MILTILRACHKEVDEDRPRPLRPSYFSKYKCAASLLKPEYGNFLHPGVGEAVLVWDGEDCNYLEYLKQLPFKAIHYCGCRSNQGSLEMVLDLVDEYKDEYEAFFLSEDDHAYLPNAFTVLCEGLTQFSNQFVALGDHPDRYRMGNGDLISTDGVYTTRSSHWRMAESYVFSFGFSSTLFKVYKDRLHEYNTSGNGAVRDRDFFRSILPEGIRLFTPIPGRSTHMIKTDLSPCIDWRRYNEEIKP